MPLSVSEATRELEASGVDYERLRDNELKKFESSFERQFVRANPYREMRELYLRHQNEILMGAMIARAQMDAGFDGQFPGSNRIGMHDIRAAYMGIGDDWEDCGTFTTGSAQNWIHSGTSILGGTDGNPIRIGKNAVHVVIAIGSLTPSPKLEAAYMEIDGNPYPVITLFPWKYVPFDVMPVKELDYGVILNENKEFLVKVIATTQHGATVSDVPCLIGASFIKEPQMRKLDTYDLIGTASNRDTHEIVKTV